MLWNLPGRNGLEGIDQLEQLDNTRTPQANRRLEARRSIGPRLDGAARAGA
jgi:hypothetical protein